MKFRDEVKNWFIQLQGEISKELEIEDGLGKFNSESWTRTEGGGGKSNTLVGGKLIEKGGVNFSAVEGPLPKALEKSFGVQEVNFFATGVSLVIHPINPFIPIIHMNVRYFEMDGGRSWFGGGIDLTPHYIVQEDARFFHQSLKNTCDRFDSSYYDRFKKWADDYFFISHRNETRGIGGLFFDRMELGQGKSLEEIFEFVKGVGKSFIPIYSYFLNKYKDSPYSEHEKKWQWIRRGRYVEFNLVYDAGTKFGLETNGRIESILMSLPPMASWPAFQETQNEYPNKSLEAFTQDHLKKGIDWLSV